MATRRSASKARRPQGPTVADESAGQEMRRRARQPLPLDDAPSLIERVEAQRERLFKAMSILECCKNASATLYDVDDCEYMVPAFETIYDLLDTSAGELDRIMTALDRVVASEPRQSGEGSGAA